MSTINTFAAALSAGTQATDQNGRQVQITAVAIIGDTSIAMTKSGWTANEVFIHSDRMYVTGRSVLNTDPKLDPVSQVRAWREQGHDVTALCVNGKQPRLWPSIHHEAA